jgi:hypothetical protein
MDNFAPILIPTLNRNEHLLRCLQSLLACINADKTDIYIALDYPGKEVHWDGYKKIERLLENIKGFKSINIIKRNSNYGAVKNFHESLTELFKKYDRIILSEDDNVFAPSFINLVNQGLMVYEKRTDIFSISGYNIPLSFPTWYNHDAYLVTAFTAWGVGVWKDKWEKVDWSLDNFNTLLSKIENYKKLKKYYLRYLPQLIKMSDTGILVADSVLFLYLLDRNMYSVYPVKSRVKNTGHDGTGENCGYSDLYINQYIYEGTEEVNLPHDLQPDKIILDLFLKHLQLPFFQRIKGKIPTPIYNTLRHIIKNKH